MEKNYYEILGVEPTASLREITKAYGKIYATYSKDMPRAEKERVLEASRAYSVLKEADARAAYDEELAVRADIAENVSEVLDKSVETEGYLIPDPEDAQVEETHEEDTKDISTEEVEEELPLEAENVNEDWFQKHKGKIIAGTLAGVLFVTGLVLGRVTKGDSAVPTPEPSITDNVNPTETPEPTEEVLNAKNIDEKVKQIVEENEKKGLSIDPAMVKSALFVTNINYLTAEDIYEIFANQLEGIDNQETRMSLIVEEIQNMYNYVSAVRTHNNNGNEYISMADLAYDENDKAIISELDTEYRDLVADLKSGEMTKEEYQASFKYVTEFYTGAGYLTTNGKEYNNGSLTAGGGLLSEAYWPMFAVAYRSSELETKENETDIKTLSDGDKAVINGSRYLGSIISAVNNCQVPTLDETNEKTK